MNFTCIRRAPLRGVAGLRFIAFGFLMVVSSVRAQDNELATPLCEALKGVLLEFSVAHHAGARSRLVATISEAFHHDPVELFKVQDQIDAVTTASCPLERDRLLTVLKIKTLAQALR